MAGFIYHIGAFLSRNAQSHNCEDWYKSSSKLIRTLWESNKRSHQLNLFTYQTAGIRGCIWQPLLVQTNSVHSWLHSWHKWYQLQRNQYRRFLLTSHNQVLKKKKKKLSKNTTNMNRFLKIWYFYQEDIIDSFCRKKTCPRWQMLRNKYWYYLCNKDA